MLKRTLQVTYRAARRIVILIVGVTVVLVGVILIFTPGPALVVIPAGLGILSIEFAWARRWLRKMRDAGAAAVNQVRGKRDPGEEGDVPGAQEGSRGGGGE